MNKMPRQPQGERGAALLIFVIFFLIASSILVIGIGHRMYEDLVGYRILSAGKQSFFAAEAGIEDAIYRHRDSKSYSNNEIFAIAGGTTTMSRALVVDSFQILAEGNVANTYRTGEVWLAVGDGASFSFGLQAGNGGIKMSSNASIQGNVFSNESVTRLVGAGARPVVHGDIVVAGATGIVDDIHATGSVWAHFIDDSLIDLDAYYYDDTTITATIVGRSSYPGSPDQSEADMPIPDAMIEGWKSNIETTGTVIASTSPECAGGTYIIQTDVTLNNVKIECNVELKKQGASTVITFAGPVWIEGDLSFTSGPSIIASSSLGSRSVQVVVDKESNRATSSRININQSTNFTSGNAQSYVMLISMNNDAELGGTEKAVNLAQSASGRVLVYASHGLIAMGNSTSLKEATGYQIQIGQGAEVIYESGLMSLLFTGGPGGGFTITSWKEVE